MRRFFVIAAMLLAGCAADRATLYLSLDAADRELFDRSRQFMTDRQQLAFLELPDNAARARFVEELHIPERLAKFPVFVQEAILGGRVVPGMTAEAVLLAWGRPQEIERRDDDGVPLECWSFSRGDREGRAAEVKVFFLAGQVSEVVQSP